MFKFRRLHAFQSAADMGFAAGCNEQKNVFSDIEKAGEILLKSATGKEDGQFTRNNLNDICTSNGSNAQLASNYSQNEFSKTKIQKENLQFENKKNIRLKNNDIADFANIVELSVKHQHQLFDDFAPTIPLHLAQIIENAQGNFWTIRRKRDGKFAGYVYLYDIIGGKIALNENSDKGEFGEMSCTPKAKNGYFMHCATISTCFAREFWGDCTYNCAKKFVRYCFRELGFAKLKCEVFATNPYISGLLKKLNFEVEGRLKGETLVRGRNTDIIIWALEHKNWDKKFKNRDFKKNFTKVKKHEMPKKLVKQGKKKEVEPPEYTSRSINNRKIISIFAKKGKDY